MSKAAELAKMGEVLTNSQIGGRRNILINGAMQVSQRATSATFNSSTGAYQTVDRFRFAGNRDQYVATLSQASDSPSGFAHSFKVATTTQETSLDADNQLNIQHRLEGQDLQQLKKGTSDAEKLTLSFYVKSSIATTFSVNLVDNDNTRTIASTYTINVADTWEFKTITFAGDTTGALDNDNARSLDLKFWLDGGTTYTSGTLATSWASSNNANNISATTNFMTTANSTWQITGIQLEVGSTATPFEHRSFGEELLLCKRYYYKLGGDTAYQTVNTVVNFTTGSMLGHYQHPVQMRAEATITKTGSWSTLGGDTTVGQTLSADQNGPNTIQLGFSGGSGGTSGKASTLRWANDTSASLQFNAEL